MDRGGRPPTLVDVARVAQVSVSTASRVINGKSTVATPMRKAVERAIEQLGYVPDQMARSLRSGRIGAIGALVPDLSFHPLLTLVRAADACASERGYTLAIRDSRRNGDVESAHVRQLTSQRVDGILLVSSVHVHDNVKRLADCGTPVAPDFVLDKQRLIAVRATGETDAIRAAVERLVAAGHERVMLVVVGSFIPPSLDARLHVWRDVCRSTPLRVEADDVVVIDPDDVAASLGTRLDDRQTCVVSFTEPSLLTVIEALRLADRTIGEDVSLLTHGDPPWARLWRPPISVITRDMVKEGRTHTAQLIDVIENPTITPEYRFEPSVLIERASMIG